MRINDKSANTKRIAANVNPADHPIGIGLAALGRPGYINLGHAEDMGRDTSVEAMKAHAFEMLDAAWSAGVRYFDAARSYGRAEEFLGYWLHSRDLMPGDVIVGSKWGYTYTADWQITVPDGTKHEVKEHSLATLDRQMRETNAELGEYLSLYQVHSATLESGVLDNQPLLAELAKVRDFFAPCGLSVSGPNQAETILRALELEFDGKLLFSSVQATWNLLEPSAGPALQAAHDAGLMVIVKEAVANGRLTDRNDSPGFAPKQAQLTEMATQLNTTVDALAIAAALNQPWSNIVLSGAARAEHLTSNLGATEVVWDEGIIEECANLQEEPLKYWATRSSLTWN